MTESPLHKLIFPRNFRVRDLHFISLGDASVFLDLTKSILQSEEAEDERSAPTGGGK